MTLERRCPVDFFLFHYHNLIFNKLAQTYWLVHFNTLRVKVKEQKGNFVSLAATFSSARLSQLLVVEKVPYFSYNQPFQFSLRTVDDTGSAAGCMSQDGLPLYALVLQSLLLSFVIVTSLPWPHRQMYSCIKQKGGRTSSNSPRRKGSEDPRMFKRTITPQYKWKWGNNNMQWLQN